VISLLELNSHGYPTSKEIDANLSTLLERLNKVREAYGIPMTVTSGLRSDAQQQALITAGKSNAPKSHHLTGEAADILDQGGKLKAWVEANISLLEEIGLWMEDFSATPNWVHFQIVPPHSGHRFFLP
jgi:LAS superfamily LD-carboxypeptidase LdcB